MARTRKTKVAVLGGGLGAMTTAFLLTNRPNLRARHDVTVYQMGWRIGGKGASGRNAGRAQRIEEHGPHFFMGFYTNAFWLMQKCYADLGRPPAAPLADWRDAFQPHSLITLMEQRAGNWSQWPMAFPRFSAFEPGFPGHAEIPKTGGEPLTIWQLLVRLLDWLGDFYDQLPLSLRLVNLRPFLEPAAHLAQTFAVRFVHAMMPLLDQMVGWMQRFLDTLDTIVGGRLALDDHVRRIWIVLRLGVAIAIGLVVDRVPLRGFNILDGEDLRAWLTRHGAPHDAVWSAPVQAIYDLVFAYEKGATARPNLAAGTGLRGTLRMVLDYRGAFMWKMQAGMGDVIFAPLYQVLKKRGVKFRFFHRVRNLALSANKKTVDRIDLDVQAAVKPGAPGGEYQPLVDVKNLPCFPSEPLYDQLVNGAALKASGENAESAWTSWPSTPMALRRGADFDEVVLGIALGALPGVAPELLAARKKWRDMAAQVGTVQTQHMQLWLNRDARELGWEAPERQLFGSYVQPWNTVTDMAQLVDREDFPTSSSVKTIAYSCGPFEDDAAIPPPGPHPAFPAAQLARVKQAALDFARASIAPVWPGAVDPANPAGLDWSALVDLDNQAGAARFDSQFFKSNIDPTERYVLSLVGSTPYRLKASQSGFENLTLAGDWTLTGLNAGCAEAAVMSGIEAARAISGEPFRIVGEKDRR